MRRLPKPSGPLGRIGMYSYFTMQRLGFLPQTQVDLGDLGAGIVNTTTQPGSGLGVATFTRASTAWTKLASGLWASIGAGSPRSTYFGMNTAVGVYAGYFSEGARLQLVTPTASIRDMTDASWVKTTMNAVKTATGIDGVVNSASTITATGAAATILQTLVAAATNRTYSCWIKRRTGVGAVILQQNATTLDITAQINSVTYTQVQLNANVLNSAFGIQLATNGDAVDVDFNQFEAGGFATSPIDTAGGTRLGDVLTYPFAGNASAAQGTAYAELSTLWTSAVGIALSFAAAQFILDVEGGASTTIVVNDGVNVANKVGLSDMFTGVRKRASTWGTIIRITGDGATPVGNSFVGSFGSTQISIGSNVAGGQQWNGTIRNVRIFNQQFSDVNLQALTS